MQNGLKALALHLSNLDFINLLDRNTLKLRGDLSDDAANKIKGAFHRPTQTPTQTHSLSFSVSEATIECVLLSRCVCQRLNYNDAKVANRTGMLLGLAQKKWP
jgi:hypothetical protein